MGGTHLDITERKERERERIIASQLLQESQKVAKVDAGVAVRLTGIFQDISEQKDIQRRLEKSGHNLEGANAALQLSAHYDALTELPNRILLSDRMQHAMTPCVRRNQVVAIAFIDLDGLRS
jgi:PleD family two-component response regulator